MGPIVINTQGAVRRAFEDPDRGTFLKPETGARIPARARNTRVGKSTFVRMDRICQSPRTRPLGTRHEIIGGKTGQ